jgi:hypothetical protein
MLENLNNSDTSLDGILESLSIREEAHDSFYQTRSREDYEVLLQAALHGEVPDHVSVGRSGIYLNKVRVAPPSENLSY